MSIGDERALHPGQVIFSDTQLAARSEAMSEYKLNPDAIQTVEDWLQDSTVELGALKHQAWLLIKDLRARIAELEVGAKDEDGHVREAAMQHPNATPATLEADAKDEDGYVREAAMQHPNATTAMLEAGAKDEDWRVRAAAKRRLAATTSRSKKTRAG